VARAEPAEGAVEARELACRRGGRLVFERVTFSLRPGEALLLKGANGTGKSSLLRLMAGFLAPHAGRLAWAGRAIAERRHEIHFLGHGDPLKPLLTAAENLAFLADLGGGGRIAAGLEAMALSDLADTPCRFLSAGQKRRLSLARLPALTRPLWLLDEPAVGLDRASRGRLETMIGEHLAQGGMAMVATHGDIAVAGAPVLELGG